MNEVPVTQRSRARTPTNRTPLGFGVSNARWAVRAPRMPQQVTTHRCGGGRARVPDRQCAAASCFVRRRGCPWQALRPTAVCATSTAHDRFQPWVAAGVFLKLWQAGVEQFDERQGSDSCCRVIRIGN